MQLTSSTPAENRMMLIPTKSIHLTTPSHSYTRHFQSTGRTQFTMDLKSYNHESRMYHVSSYPTKEDILCNYAAYLANQGLSHQTIKCYLHC